MLIPFSQFLALRKYIYTKKTEQIESNQTRNRNTPHKNIYSRNKRRGKVQILQIHPLDLDVLFACLLKANDFNQLFEAHPSRPSLVFFCRCCSNESYAFYSVVVLVYGFQLVSVNTLYEIRVNPMQLFIFLIISRKLFMKGKTTLKNE